MKEYEKIGLGGSCHWCTEAIFLSLRGIKKVEQGWIASVEKEAFSEAIIVHYDPAIIGLTDLIRIHLYTHSSTKQHSMRDKYRLAIYCFSDPQKEESVLSLRHCQEAIQEKIITELLTYKSFKLNKKEQLINYYYSNPDKPFCQNVINPKLKLILNKFSHQVNKEKLKILP